MDFIPARSLLWGARRGRRIVRVHWKVRRGSRSTGPGTGDKLVEAAQGLIAVASEVVADVKEAICDGLPDGRVSGAGGALGVSASSIAGGDLVLNYNTGEVSAFAYGGFATGVNGGATASLYNGLVWGLGDSNAGYSRGFVGFVGFGGGTAVGGFGAVSSSAKAGPDFSGVRVLAVSVNVGLSIVSFSANAFATYASSPVHVGNLRGSVLASGGDQVMFAAKQACK